MLPLISLAIQAAPLIAKWIGGSKAEETIKDVTEAAGSIFGTSDPQAIEKKIAEDKSLYVQWQLALNTLVDNKDQRQHEERLAEFKDVVSARETYKDSKNVADVLAKITVGAFFALNTAALYGMYLLLTSGVKISGNIEIWLTIATLFGTLLGFINSKTELVYSFFFGSSKSSDNKNETISNAINKLVKNSVQR